MSPTWPSPRAPPLLPWRQPPPPAAWGPLPLGAPSLTRADARSRCDRATATDAAYASTRADKDAPPPSPRAEAVGATAAAPFAGRPPLPPRAGAAGATATVPSADEPLTPPGAEAAGATAAAPPSPAPPPPRALLELPSPPSLASQPWPKARSCCARVATEEAKATAASRTSSSGLSPPQARSRRARAQAAAAASSSARAESAAAKAAKSPPPPPPAAPGVLAAQCPPGAITSEAQTAQAAVPSPGPAVLVQPCLSASDHCVLYASEAAEQALAPAANATSAARVAAAYAEERPRSEVAKHSGRIR